MISMEMKCHQKRIILEFNQHMMSDKMPYITYADMESLIKKIDECANNPENSSAIKLGEHNPCGAQCQQFGHLINIDEELKKRFKNTFKFFNNDINKSILLLRKDVYPCKHMDDWGNFNATT